MPKKDVKKTSKKTPKLKNIPINERPKNLQEILDLMEKKKDEMDKLYVEFQKEIEDSWNEYERVKDTITPEEDAKMEKAIMKRIKAKRKKIDECADVISYYNEIIDNMTYSVEEEYKRFQIEHAHDDEKQAEFQKFIAEMNESIKKIDEEMKQIEAMGPSEEEVAETDREFMQLLEEEYQSSCESLEHAKQWKETVIKENLGEELLKLATEDIKMLEEIITNNRKIKEQSLKDQEELEKLKKEEKTMKQMNDFSLSSTKIN